MAGCNNLHPVIYFINDNTCVARGAEDSCFATPLACEEFASELFISCKEIGESYVINTEYIKHFK